MKWEPESHLKITSDILVCIFYPCQGSGFRITFILLEYNNWAKQIPVLFYLFPFSNPSSTPIFQIHVYFFMSITGFFFLELGVGVGYLVGCANGSQYLSGLQAFWSWRNNSEISEIVILYSVFFGSLGKNAGVHFLHRSYSASWVSSPLSLDKEFLSPGF